MSETKGFAKKTTKKTAKVFPVLNAPVDLVDSVIKSIKELKKAGDNDKKLKSDLRASLIGSATNLVGESKSFILKGSDDSELLFGLNNGFRSNVDTDKLPEKFHDRLVSKSSLEIKADAVSNEAFMKDLLKLANKHGVHDQILLKEIKTPKSLEILLEGTTPSEAQLLDEVVKFPTTFKNR